MRDTLRGYGDNFTIVILVEDDILHTPEKPFCWDATCGCHTDETLFQEVEQFVLDGLLTIPEAMAFLAGRTV